MATEKVNPDQPQSDLMRSMREEADDLDEFGFEDGDVFSRYHPWGDERAEEDLWSITDRSFEYTVRWIRGRDDVPTSEHHRHYTLLSYQDLEEVLVSEAALLRGLWVHVDELADDQLTTEEREVLGRDIQ
jgi:cbb3-type cytochrome oxidase cytochrome c subunit